MFWGLRDGCEIPDEVMNHAHDRAADCGGSIAELKVSLKPWRLRKLSTRIPSLPHSTLKTGKQKKTGDERIGLKSSVLMFPGSLMPRMIAGLCVVCQSGVVYRSWVKYSKGIEAFS